MTYIVVFDTETNGACRPDGCMDPSLQELTQLSWILAYTDGTEIRKDYIISGASHIHYNVPHDITMKDVRTRGVAFPIVVDTFMTDIMHASVIIGHNISFDKNVIISELRRRNIPSVRFEARMRERSFCTMRNTASICGLVDKAGRRKQPKLSELHHHFFGTYPDGKLHDALYDCEITLRCYVAFKNSTSILSNGIRSDTH